MQTAKRQGGKGCGAHHGVGERLGEAGELPEWRQSAARHGGRGGEEGSMASLESSPARDEERGRGGRRLRSSWAPWLAVGRPVATAMAGGGDGSFGRARERVGEARGRGRNGRSWPGEVQGIALILLATCPVAVAGWEWHGERGTRGRRHRGGEQVRLTTTVAWAGPPSVLRRPR